jgi:magnesium-protoporphyrin O-methyltransferase
MSDYAATRDRVEHYFDRSATKVWERLTSDAPVSRIRQTVREGRDRMRAAMLSRLPADLHGVRVLDAGCGAGQMTAELAARGADVTAVDISPALVEIARTRLPAEHANRVRFESGDMLAPALGRFDHVVAMDSMIYYSATDIARALDELGERTAASVVFTVAPKTPFLMAFWTLGKAFPRADRSPTMVPHAFDRLARATGNRLSRVERVSRGFYISDCLEFRP